MDSVEREQIRLLLDHHGAKCREKTALRNRAMHADHSAKGTLQSGATVRAALRIAEEMATAYVTDIVAAVSNVAQDIEAFNMIVTNVTIMLREQQPSIDDAVKLATARIASGQRFDSVGNEAIRLFSELESKTLRLLKIHQFTFIRPSPNDRKALRSSITLKALPPAANKGGKPLAAHWDQMWSSVAVRLWLGDLKPKRQADIKEAMLTWFADNEIEIGDTAVTERARQIWQKMEDAQ